TATTGTWTASPTSYSFAWKLCGAAATSCISVGGDLDSYLVGPTDVGARLVVVVTARNAAGSTSVDAAPAAVSAGTSRPAPSAPEPRPQPGRGSGRSRAASPDRARFEMPERYRRAHGTRGRSGESRR